MDRWEYLTTREFQLRQHVCKYYLDDVDYVFDIGAYRKTFDRENVIAIDPLNTIPNAFHGTLREWVLSNKIPSNYAVVVMGLDIEGGVEEFNCLISLMKNSEISIIEHPIRYEPAAKQLDQILLQTGMKPGTVVEFTFPDVQTPGFKPFLERRLIVLER